MPGGNWSLRWNYCSTTWGRSPFVYYRNILEKHFHLTPATSSSQFYFVWRICLHIQLHKPRQTSSSVFWTKIQTCCSGALAARRAAKRGPISIPYMGNKRKPMSWFSHSYRGQRYCSWARTRDDDDGVAQHTPNNRLSETWSLALLYNSLVLDIHVMINWHLSKQGTRWPVSRDHIAGSS